MKKERLLSTVVACALSMSGRANAESELEALLSEPVISTASKSAERASHAPGTSAVVTAEEIRRHGLRTLNEVINYASLGMVTTNPLHSVEIGARGVLVTADYGNHVQLLIDGHTVNEPWNGTAYFERGVGVPFELISHIEFVLGPGSVLYGSEAMLGVINIVTKRAREYSGVRVIAEGELATADFDANDLGTGFRLSAGAGYEFRAFQLPAEFTVQLEYYEQDGPTFTLGPQQYGDDSVTGMPKTWSADGPGTGVWGGRATESYYSRAPAAYARFLVGDLKVSARASAYERASPYLDSLSFVFGDFNERENRERDRFASLDIEHQVVLSSRLTLKSRVYADLYDYDWNARSTAPEDCYPDQLEGCVRKLHGDAQWSGAEGRGHLDWLGNGRLETLIGVDGKVRRVDVRSVVVDRATSVTVDSSRPYTRVDHSAAAYVQQVARATAYLTFNAGARLDWDARFGANVSPRLATSIYPWPKATFKLLYAEAFRGPAAYQLEAEDPTYMVRAQDLRPETVRSVEASFEQRFRRQRLSFGLFRAWWDDLIFAETLSETETAEAIERGDLLEGTLDPSQYRNSSRIDNYGLVAAYEGSLLEHGRLQYGLNLTSAYSRFRAGSSSSVPLTVSPQLFGNARISYALSGALPTLALALQFQERRPADRAYDGGHTPQPVAPPHAQVRGAVNGAFPALPGLSYRVVLDYSFTTEGPYVIGPNAWVYSEEPTAAELAPVERMRAIVGLEYRFPE